MNLDRDRKSRQKIERNCLILTLSLWSGHHDDDDDQNYLAMEKEVVKK